MEERLRKAQFTLADFQTQLAQIKKMGGLGSMLAMMPGAGQLKGMKNMDIDERQLDRINAIIDSMTAKERLQPKIINGSRRERIARGSGTICHRGQSAAQAVRSGQEDDEAAHQVGREGPQRTRPAARTGLERTIRPRPLRPNSPNTCGDVRGEL